jgi:transcriptional regulator with XRE-family HTH domain
VIYLNRHQDIGALLRHLRDQAGISAHRVARRSHVSLNAIYKREGLSDSGVRMFIEHTQVIGYRVAIVRERRRRQTGTGWPA